VSRPRGARVADEDEDEDEHPRQLNARLSLHRSSPACSDRMSEDAKFILGF
jgi:hypothetical protein